MDDWLRSKWVIVDDPESAEYVRTPDYQLWLEQRRGYLTGDCDDASTLAASLLHALNWPCRLIAIRKSGEPEFSHVFVRCLENGGLVDIDPIVPLEQLPLQGYAETIEIEV